VKGTGSVPTERLHHKSATDGRKGVAIVPSLAVRKIVRMKNGSVAKRGSLA
jgi:hypothetical protein